MGWSPGGGSSKPNPKTPPEIDKLSLIKHTSHECTRSLEIKASLLITGSLLKVTPAFPSQEYLEDRNGEVSTVTFYNDKLLFFSSCLFFLFVRKSHFSHGWLKQTYITYVMLSGQSLTFEIMG